MDVRTGDIVLYRYCFPALGKPEEAVAEAAIVTCTHEDWSPGYHDTNGTWIPNATIKQPAKGYVHLTVFYVNAVPAGLLNVPHASLAAKGESYYEARP